MYGTTKGPTALTPAAVERLGSWLAEQSSHFRGPITSTALISGGRSNITTELVDASGARFVLRRPPDGAHLDNAHDMLREARTISAVTRAGVAAPEVIAQSDATSVIGVPFFVMRFVEGSVLATPEAARAAGIAGDPARAEALARSLVSTLVAIHTVEIDAVGLTDMRRRSTYVARQLRRFTGSLSRLDASPARDRLLALGDLLSGAAPAERSVRLVHGDYKLGNVIVHAPAEDGAGSPTVAAVLDWELASTGDPAADVGWLVASWAQPGDGPWLVPPATIEGGFGSRDDIAEHYVQASGQDLPDLDFYVAFAYWRWSAINLGTRQRFVDGGGSGGAIDLPALDAQVDWQLDRVAELLH